jgi:hypothetical protein
MTILMPAQTAPKAICTPQAKVPSGETFQPFGRQRQGQPRPNPVTISGILASPSTPGIVFGTFLALLKGGKTR